MSTTQLTIVVGASGLVFLIIALLVERFRLLRAGGHQACFSCYVPSPLPPDLWAVLLRVSCTSSSSGSVYCSRDSSYR